MIARIERPYRVRFDESGPDGHLPASGILRYVQDIAWVHSNEEGFGREWYGARQLTWLIRAIELEIRSPVGYGAELNVSTEVVGFRRVWARRRSEVTGSGDRRPIAQATIDWVLLDAAGAPTRIPDEIDAAFAPPHVPISPLRVRLPPVPAHAHLREFTVRRSELDPMAHVNNAAYFDYIDEDIAVGSGGQPSTALPRRYVVEFAAPAESSMHLLAGSWEGVGGLYWRLASGAGRELVRAFVNWPAPWKSQPKQRS